MSIDEVLALLQRWQTRGWIRPLDGMFSRFLHDLDTQAEALLLLAAALVSHQLGRGHICLCLSAVLADPDAHLALPAEQQDSGDWADLPARCLAGVTLSDWLDSLQASRLVGAGPGNSPLVLVADRLYLRRYWQYEIAVAAGIMARVRQRSVIPVDLAEQLARLFPAQAGANGPDWQKIACALAMRSAFTVITGGPGTGKTTTVVRLLALLQHSARQQQQVVQIRLAAPTGKAAARLTESIGQSLATLPANMQHDIPTEACTLHKLLGARPGTRHLRHNASNPIHADVVIVDEASMIDLEMMAALLSAMPPASRLVLLGDKDQLASVEAGSVLGDLCQHAEQVGYQAETIDWLAHMTGQALRVEHGTQGLLDQQIAMLRVSHRFDDRSGIGQLALAVNAGSPQRVQAVWQAQPGFTDIKRWQISRPEDARLKQLLVEGWQALDEPLAGSALGYRHYLQVINQQRPAATAGADAHQQWAGQVLQAFDQFRLLCALRKGRWGVEALNQHIAEVLSQQALISQTHGWYEGRPVMVTRNDYSLGLMNGDIGIALQMPDAEEGSSRLRVVFRQTAQQLKYLLPSRLNDVETVYAMTVHKAQGSEFSHVALLLPDQPNPVLTRELIYTGITRAKQCFSLLTADEAVWLQSIGQRVKRSGGLAEGLG